MSLMLAKLINRGVVFNAEGGGAGGSDAPSAAGGDVISATGGAQDATSILYPDDKPAGAETAAAGDDAPAWKEYEADPAKSDEENAAAKAEHDKGKPAEADSLDVVPEDGKYTLTMPEGIELDTEMLDALAPEFKAAGLTQRQAQALTDKYIARQKADAEARAEGWAKTNQEWVSTAKKDAEIGGPKWDASVANAQRAINQLGTPALKDFLNASGGGNHPEVIRFMAKVGAKIADDNPAASENPGQKKATDPVAILYPNDKPKG